MSRSLSRLEFHIVDISWFAPLLLLGDLLEIEQRWLCCGLLRLSYNAATKTTVVHVIFLWGSVIQRKLVAAICLPNAIREPPDAPAVSLVANRIRRKSSPRSPIESASRTLESGIKLTSASGTVVPSCFSLDR